MSWLIWKEYRVQRLILIFGAIVLLAPHVTALALTLRWPDLQRNCFDGSLYFSLMFSQVVLALLGGNAIAGERADRSAEFLACLPFSRRQHLASKLIFSPLAATIIWVVNLSVLCLVRSGAPSAQHHPETDWCVCVAIMGLTFFCVSWCASCLLESGVFSIAIGLVTPWVIGMGIGLVFWWLDLSADTLDDGIAGSWILGIYLVLSLVCFLSGTAYYLRRVEP